MWGQRQSIVHVRIASLSVNNTRHAFPMPKKTTTNGEQCQRDQKTKKLNIRKLLFHVGANTEIPNSTGVVTRFVARVMFSSSAVGTLCHVTFPLPATLKDAQCYVRLVPLFYCNVSALWRRQKHWLLLFTLLKSPSEQNQLNCILLQFDFQRKGSIRRLFLAIMDCLPFFSFLSFSESFCSSLLVLLLLSCSGIAFLF